MTEEREIEALNILDQVRTMLSKAFENNLPECFAMPILTNYPIKSIKNQNGVFKFHGWCEMETKSAGWERKLNVEKAKEFSVRNLFVQLISENGSILPMY